MRIFVTKAFRRFMRAEVMTATSLVDALADFENGRGASDLGGGVFKLRVARQGRGKSAGFRVIVLLRMRRRAVFEYGYAKSDMSNIGSTDLEAFRALAKVLLDANDKEIEAALANATLFELTRETGDGSTKGKE